MVAEALQCRVLHPTVGEATTVSQIKTAKEHSPVHQVMLCALWSFWTILIFFCCSVLDSKFYYLWCAAYNTNIKVRKIFLCLAAILLLWNSHVEFIMAKWHSVKNYEFIKIIKRYAFFLPRRKFENKKQPMLLHTYVMERVCACLNFSLNTIRQIFNLPG
jgi:hypothetical protein